MIKEFTDFRKFTQDCQVVFDSPQGQRVLKYLMKKGCVTTPVAATTPEESLRNEGAQRLVLSILRAMKQDTEQQLLDDYET
jgi:hypothetical protein